MFEGCGGTPALGQVHVAGDVPPGGIMDLLDQVPGDTAKKRRSGRVLLEETGDVQGAGDVRPLGRIPPVPEFDHRLNCPDTDRHGGMIARRWSVR